MRLLAIPILVVAGAVFVLSAQARPELIVSVGHSTPPHHMAFAGGYLATAGWSKVALVDLSTGLTVAHLPIAAGHISALETSPSEDLLAIGTCGRAVELWNVTTRHLVRRIAVRRECVEAVAFSPDGALLATVDVGNLADSRCCDPYGGVQIWDVRSGALKQEIANRAGIRSLVFGRNGRWLAGADGEGKTIVFEWPSGRQLRTLTSPQGAEVPESGGISSPDGKYLAWRGFRDLHLWNVEDGTRVALVQAIASEFLDDGRLAYVDEDLLRIVTLPSGSSEDKPLEKPKLVVNGDLAHEESPEWRRIHRNGRTIAGSYDSRTVVWDTGAATLRHLTSPKLTDAATLQWHRTGIIAWGDMYSGLWVWSEASGQPLEFDTDDWSVKALSFDGDGRRLAAAGYGFIQTLDVQRRRYIRSEHVNSGAATAIAFSRDGSRVAAGLLEGLALFDDSLRQQTLITRLKAGSVEHVDFSPDGQWIAAALSADNVAGVKVWPAAGSGDGDGVTLDTRDVTYGPQPTAFSSDSRWLATFITGKSLTLWSTGSWKLERTWTLPGTGRALMFAPQGPRLAIAADGEAAIWDGDTGRKLVTLSGEGTSRVQQIAWSPDGDRLVTSSDDGVLRFWSASNGRLLASLYAIGDTRDWLLVTPDGRFDGSKRALATLVAWRTGDRVSLDKRLTEQHRVRDLWRQLSPPARRMR